MLDEAVLPAVPAWSFNIKIMEFDRVVPLVITVCDLSSCMSCVGLVCLADPAIALLPVVGEVVSGTAGTWSLPLLDRAEIGSE